MSLIYYSRIRFIIKLMPLLLAAPQPAHVVSVYAGGLEAKLFEDDLSLRNPKHFNEINVRSHNAHLTTMAFEHLAKQHEKVSFVHVFPGIVITPSYSDSGFPLWFKIIWCIVGPIVRLTQAIPHEDAGSRMLFYKTPQFAARSEAASTGMSVEIVEGTDRARGSGAYAVNAKSDVATTKADYAALRKKGFEDRVWKHTMRAFDVIESGHVFKD